MGKKRKWLLIEEIRKGGGIKSIRSFSTVQKADEARAKRIAQRVPRNRIYVVRRRKWETQFKGKK